MKKIKQLTTPAGVVVLLILIIAFGIRVYRVDQILGFYFDQGRDALVIWDLWHRGKLFLIGPTTGIEGIFRGPWYYWLIAPFYLLGNGNPVYPSVFLALSSVVTIGFLYYLGTKMVGKEAGIMAVIIASFSYRLVMASRWLSNPTPMLLLSVLLLWAMFKVIDGKKWGWPVIAFTSGLSLFNFGSAAEVFYFPALLIFIFWQRKNLPDKKSLIWSIVLFIASFLPLVLFELKHGWILTQNIKKFFVTDKSFSMPSWIFVMDKVRFYSDVFSNKIFYSFLENERLIFGGLMLVFILCLKKLLVNKYFKATLLIFCLPLLGLIFFQGNFGNIYDYYLTGYYLVFVLLIASALGLLWKGKLSKIIVLLFFCFFLNSNLKPLMVTLNDKAQDPQSVAFVNQKKALDWVYADSEGKEFNVDVYVPPVIPHAYNYLFKWYGGEKYGRLPLEENRSLLYTLYEIDSPHPERLEAWLARQKGIGKVIEKVRFGGITVERRERI